MNLRATTAGESSLPHDGTMKFTYPSGSRPLDGYTIKRGVGRGGFGEVYYATSDGGKDVALKLIRRNLDVELRGVMQCLNLKHPNLVGLFDTKKDDHDDSWVVMEYVRGESLEDAIARQPEGMPVEEALGWLHGIAAGVAYLHDQGIVHRDLKPGNIFDDDGMVKIGDYGLSKFIAASRRSGQTESVGTVHYMAPEIANGRYGKEIDIYALGVILYEMLTGHVPFEGESVGEVLMKHLTAEPDLSRLAEPYRSVVGRALTKDPEHRYRNVRELLAALPASAAPPAFAPPRQAPSGPRPEDGRAAHNGAAAGSVPVARPARPADPGATPEAPPEEPVWRAISDGIRRMKDSWNRANFPAPIKVLLLVVGVFLAISSAGIWVPALAFLCMAYLVYLAIRAIVVPSPKPPPYTPPAQTPPPQQAATPPPRPQRPPVVHQRRSHRVRRERPMLAMPVKSARQQATELFGSLLLSAGVVVAMAVVTTLVMAESFRPQQLVWMSLVGILGSWGVLIPSKFWEGTQGEPIVRRMVLLVMGLMVGWAAFQLDRGLLVDLQHSASMAGYEGSYRAALFDAAGQPTLRGYLAYFAFLFPILRWWRMADPLRWSRFSLWSTAVAVLWAGLLTLAWPFPQTWGMVIAATIAVAVQLASPWMEQRQRVMQQIV